LPVAIIITPVQVKEKVIIVLIELFNVFTLSARGDVRRTG